MPLTDAQKSARKRQKKRDAGLVLMQDWVTPKQKAEIKDYLDGKSRIVKDSAQQF